MSTIVLMKAFEHMPGKYDLGMRLVTLGAIDRIHKQIADSVASGDSVLDIGCGTGRLLSLLLKKDAVVTAIDRSPEMIEAARERVDKEGTCNYVRLSQNTVMEADRLFSDAEFDTIILSLVLSELTEEEQSWVLKECVRMLKHAGVLIIADEFRPYSFPQRLLFSVVRLPVHLTAYLYTQIKGLITTSIWWKLYYTIVELPLMLISFLVSEPLTRPLSRIEQEINGKLRIINSSVYGFGSIRLLKIRKEA